MSRFRKLSHCLWHCQYHLVWCPKYRYRVMIGPVKSEIEQCIIQFTNQLGAEIVELLRCTHYENSCCIGFENLEFRNRRRQGLVLS